jgi:hypothetical protein
MTIRGRLLKRLEAPLFPYDPTVSDLCAFTREQLLETRGIGPATLKRIEEALAKHGLVLRRLTVGYYDDIDRDESPYFVKRARNIELRRAAIKKLIENSAEVINAWELATKFCVSDTTIKKDVKVLGLKIRTGKQKP